MHPISDQQIWAQDIFLNISPVNWTFYWHFLDVLCVRMQMFKLVAPGIFQNTSSQPPSKMSRNCPWENTAGKYLQLGKTTRFKRYRIYSCMLYTCNSVCNLCVCVTDEKHRVLLGFMYPHGPPVSVCVAPGSWAGSSAPRCRWPPSASPAAPCGRCPPLCRSPPWWCRPRAADLAGRSCRRGGSWQSPARHSLPEMSLPMQTDSSNIRSWSQHVFN